MNSGPAPSLAACSVSSCWPLFASGAGPPKLILKGGVKPFGNIVRRSRSPRFLSRQRSLRSRRLTLRPPKPPDDGLLVADRNEESGFGLSHGSPARVLVGVKTQEG